MTASPNYKCHGWPGPLSSFIVPGNHTVYKSPCLLNARGIGCVRIYSRAQQNVDILCTCMFNTRLHSTKLN